MKHTNQSKMQKNKIQIFLDQFFHIVFMLCAFTSVIMVFAIMVFIFTKGLKPFWPGNVNGTYSIFNFLTGTAWKPSQNIFGIGYMILASIYATIGAILIGVPIGLLT
ncbi:MAG: phosphate ABC transporter permease subunit PstC, partial [Clostridiales bacterium]|nr:phosphate ABC transporter permease subunit PstC [Clostridiales bacterium]